MKYDLANFYENLKDKFSKSHNNDILKYLLIEFKKSLEAADEHAIIYVGNELASFLRLIGDTKKSYAIYGQIGLIVKKNYGDRSKEYATLLLNLGDVDIVNKDYGKGLDRFNLAYEILKQYPADDYLFASLYNNRASAYRGLKSYDKAQADIERAIEIVRDNPNKLAISNINLAEILLVQAEYSRALETVDRAISYYELSNPHDIHYANALATKGQIAFYMKNYDLSLCMYEKALSYFEGRLGQSNMTDLLRKNIDHILKIREEAKP